MEHVRALSKSLFGAYYRLEIGAAIESSAVFTLSSLHDELPHAPSLSCVSKEIGVFENSGMLVRQPQVPGMRSVYFQAQETSFWATCRELCATRAASAGVAYPDNQTQEGR